jgi:hypothetical protein
MRPMIDERASSPDFANMPGRTTGILCKEYKAKVADMVVYKVDTPTSRSAAKRARTTAMRWH